MEKKGHRVFLDSNVILSGLFSATGAPRLILDILSLDLPILAGLTGRLNLVEIERNLEKKMPGALPVYHRYLPKLNLEIVPLPSPEDVERFEGAADENDLPVLVSAVNGRADSFVTGDKKLISLIARTRLFPFKTVTPAEFLDEILPGILQKQPAPGTTA
jgi:putative PIN family toxin of toxin-antitoxin system